MLTPLTEPTIQTPTLHANNQPPHRVQNNDTSPSIPTYWQNSRGQPSWSNYSAETNPPLRNSKDSYLEPGRSPSYSNAQPFSPVKRRRIFDKEMMAKINSDQ